MVSVHFSEAIDVDDGLREGLWVFLRYVVTDAAQHTVRIFAGEFAGIPFSILSCTIEIAGNRDRGDRDRRTSEQFLLEISVLRFALRDAQPPAIVVNDDLDVIGILERIRRAIERGITELPLR